MTLIKKHTKVARSKEASFIGLYVKKEVASFLNLYSLAKGITKSEIMSKLISDWKYDRLRDCTDDELITEIAKSSLEAFHTLPKRNTTFYSFCNMLRVELKNRGLTQTVIDEIVKQTTDEKKKEG